MGEVEAFELLAVDHAGATAAADLLTDFGLRAVGERNIRLFTFTDGEARRPFGTGWAVEARRMLSLFRATHDLWPGDPSCDAIIARLRTGRPAFEAWWADHDVTMPRSGSKRLHLRPGETVLYTNSTFQANDDPSLRLALDSERRQRRHAPVPCRRLRIGHVCFGVCHDRRPMTTPGRLRPRSGRGWGAKRPVSLRQSRTAGAGCRSTTSTVGQATDGARRFVVDAPECNPRA